MSSSKTNALMVTSQKYERLEARINSQQKSLFQHAADLLGRSLTDFIVSTLQKAALQVINDHELLQLGKKDRQIFIHTLLNPPKPSKRLMKAVQRYKKEVVSE